MSDGRVVKGNAEAPLDEHAVEVGGLRTRYLAAGAGLPVVLLHATEETALDWQWVLPALARANRVYAPDLPGSGGTAAPPAAYTPEFFQGFVSAFLDRLDIERAVLVGNSLGGLAALRLALAAPERVAALVLVASGGLGQAISPAFLPLIWPGSGEIAMAWSRTPLGALQRAWTRAALLFTRPWRAPAAWLIEQQRVAQLPGFLEAQLAALRAQIGPWGQREVLLDQLPGLDMPVLIVWGDADRVVPLSQARAAIGRLRKGSLALIPDAGHLPHIEQPGSFLASVLPFLAAQSAGQ